MHITNSRTATMRITAPAAVVGTLAATLTAVPASAEEVRVTAAASHAPGTRALSAAGGAAHTAVRPAAAPPFDYTIRPGDTVWSIAAGHGVTAADLLAWNGLGWRSVIFPGQTLRVSPASAPPAAVPAPVPPAAPAPTAAHTVVRGDTVFGIARKYGTSVAGLLQANGLGEGSIIYPGQALRLTVPPPAPTATTGQRSAALDAEQTAHAAHIVRIGRELGVPDRGIAIALATAMVESSMRNLDHGDRDSLGLFQQRPSQGWGAPEQAMDADRSIRVFYGGPTDPNGATTRGLLDITGWQDMPFTAAAQAVQVSAYPDRYGTWELQAHQWIAALR